MLCAAKRMSASSKDSLRHLESAPYYPHKTSDRSLELPDCEISLN